jgi:Arc/MetJ-type ribon-helix-helix transcriptional regulator
MSARPAQSHVTLRLRPREPELLDRLAEELGGVSRTDVVRSALRLLRHPDNQAFREQIRAANVANAFLARLRREYGEMGRLEFETHEDAPRVTINGTEPVDFAGLVRTTEHFVHLDLIDKTTGVAIRNLFVTDRDEPAHVVLTLSSLYVHSPVPAPEETVARILPDGRTGVTRYEDDGTARTYILDSKGRSALLHDDVQAELPGCA